MKLRKKSILILVFAFLLSIMGANVTRAYTNVDVAFSFHDALAPYGSWVNVSTCGNCWQPRVSAGFIPYTNGHWVYTTYGPTWVGYEPWAWAAYHYGQWVFTPEFGWIWQPGYSYTPGRVVWATGPDYIGWTPYVAGGPNVNFWVMVNRDRFGYSNYSNYALRRDVVRNMFDRRVVRVHPGTLDRMEVERITNRPVRVVPVDVRTVSADRRSVKLILPKGHETAALREISHAQQRARTSAAVTTKKATTEQVNRFSSSRSRSEVKPATNGKASSSKNSKTVSHVSQQNASQHQKVSMQHQKVTEQHQKVSSHQTSTHKTSSHKTEPKSVEPKKQVEMSSKSKQQVPEKQHFSSKEKPQAKEAVSSKNVESKQDVKTSKSKPKSSESHKKRKPPQSH
jgi:hypothetical protein